MAGRIYKMHIKRLLFVYNPRSGRGVINTYLLDILRVFDAAGYTTTIYRMKYSGDGAWMAEHESENYDLLVCAGGDGTLNGVISGLMKVEPEKRPGVGFIPTGSTNDNRKNYKLPANILHAAKVAVNGNPFATDIGQFNDKFFTYVASFGELSAVSCFTPQASKNLLGHAAYIPEGLKVLLKMPSQKIRVVYDAGAEEGDYFLGMVTNATSVGGFQGITGANIDLQDGLFEVMLFKKPKDLLEFQKEVGAVLTPSDTGDGLITRLKSSRITFECEEEMQWVVDGEDAGKCTFAEIENINKAVRIMSGLVSRNKK